MNLTGSASSLKLQPKRALSVPLGGVQKKTFGLSIGNKLTSVDGAPDPNSKVKTFLL